MASRDEHRGWGNPVWSFDCPQPRGQLHRDRPDSDAAWIGYLENFLEEKEAKIDSLETCLARRDRDAKAQHARLDLVQAELDRMMKQDTPSARDRTWKETIRRMMANLESMTRDVLDKLGGMEKNFRQEPDRDARYDNPTGKSTVNEKTETSKMRAKDHGSGTEAHPKAYEARIDRFEAQLDTIKQQNNDSARDQEWKQDMRRMMANLESMTGDVLDKLGGIETSIRQELDRTGHDKADRDAHYDKTSTRKHTDEEKTKTRVSDYRSGTESLPKACVSPNTPPQQHKSNRCKGKTDKRKEVKEAEIELERLKATNENLSRRYSEERATNKVLLRAVWRLM